MPPRITRRDLHPRDLVVLRDLVRFGVLADNQIQRRYGNALLMADRLAMLEAGCLINQPRSKVIAGTSIYSATQYGAVVAGCGLNWRIPPEGHLAHDIAVVDLADYLVEHDPGAEWKTEREFGRVLRALGPRMRGLGFPKERRHTPDGLLLSRGKRLAIELEHSDKGEQRYIGICRWFACELRLDGIHWYVDNPKIIARIQKANREHGFDRDIDVQIEAFPPGVVIRAQVGSWAPSRE
ncbi:MAG: hypothetical protein LC797_02265 [Chloroflexi bacterium]|nr:hypothetical protein [Chloroflexota bacterium]